MHYSSLWGGYMQIKGVEVFDFTLKHLPLEFEKILKFSCLKKEQLSRLYFHQANSFLLSYLEEKLDVKGKLLNNMKNFGFLVAIRKKLKIIKIILF